MANSDSSDSRDGAEFDCGPELTKVTLSPGAADAWSDQSFRARLLRLLFLLRELTGDAIQIEQANGAKLHRIDA